MLVDTILIQQLMLALYHQIKQIQHVQQDNIIIQHQCNAIPVLINAALAKINCLKKN